MSRFEWALGALLAVLVVVALAATLYFWSGRETASGEAITRAPTARAAYDSALPVARRWASDAELLSASATWPDSDEFKPEAASWSLLFFSQGERGTALIAVADGQATLVSAQQQDDSFAPAPLASWQIDSEAATERALLLGGRQFVAEQGAATLVLTLHMDNRASWQAFFIQAEAGRTFSVQLDAATGEVIEAQQSLRGVEPPRIAALRGG
jgi:hypothetical protein